MSFLSWPKAKLLFAPVAAGTLGFIIWIFLTFGVLMGSETDTKTFFTDNQYSLFVLLIGISAFAGITTKRLWPQKHHSWLLALYLGWQGVIGAFILLTIFSWSVVIFIGSAIYNGYLMDGYLSDPNA